MIRGAFVFALVLLAATAQRASCTDCPQNCVRTADIDPFCSSSAAFDSTFDFFDICHSHVAYDIPLAELSASTVGSLNCSAWTDVEDDFAVVGPTAGTPLFFTAKLAVSAASGGCLSNGYATTIAWIWPEPGDTVAWRWDACKDIQHWDRRDTVLSAPVSALAGSPFRMNFWVFAGASGTIDTSDMSASVSAVFWFEGLPPGSRVTSCNGYAQDSVPTRPTTWGRLKASYR